MARRRSANRRSSMRSLNATELDRDSDRFDANNPLWWKTIEGDVTTRPSLPLSIADTTGSILDSDSRVDHAELRDQWWNNLDSTKLGSSRRFSSRRSLNPPDTYTDSIISDGNDDISIKKKRVTLRPRANNGGDSDNFLRVINQSDNTVQSESLPGKRKSKSPTRSDTEVSWKKTRTSRDRLVEASRNDRDDDSVTSNDSDVVVKPRPKAFEKRFTGKLRQRMLGNVQQNEEAGTFGTNALKSPLRQNDSPLSKISSDASPGGNSNESGLMGPPKSSSLRKRLSSISRKLHLSSNDSESDGASKRARPGLAPKSRKNLSSNPFDEILSEHVEEKNSQSGAQTNKNDVSAKSPNKSLTSRGVDRIVSSIVDEDRTPTKLNDSTSKTERSVPIDLVAPDDEENPSEKNRRAISVANEISDVSNSRLHSKLRATSNRHSVLIGDSRNRIVQDWKSSDSEDEALVDRPSKSMMNVSKESILRKTTFVVSETILSSTRISHSERINESDQENDDEQKRTPAKKGSLKSARHSRTFADSAYSLPDKERSDSPIISMSENEDNRSLDNSKRNALKITRDTTKMQSSGKTDERSPKSDSRVNDGARSSRKNVPSANISVRQTLLDDSISEEEAEEEAKNNSRSASFSAKKKSNTARKSTFHENTSRNSFVSEDRPNENVEGAKKAISISTRKSHPANASSSFQRIESDESISEEESQSEDAEKSNLNSMRNSERAEGRNTNAARNSFAHADISGQGRIESGDAADAANSKTANLDAKRKASAARNSSATVSAQPRDSAESVSEKNQRINDERKINSKTTNLSSKRKASLAEESNARGNVSGQRVQTDEGSSEEEEDDERNHSKSLSIPAKGNMSTRRTSAYRGNVSRQRIESDAENDHDGYKSKSKGKTSKPGKSTADGNVSGQRLESKKENDHHGNKSNSKFANSFVKEKPSKPGRRNARGKISEQSAESDDSEEEVEDSQPPRPSTAKEVNKSTRPSKNSTITRDTTGPKNLTLSMAKNFEAEDSTVASEVVHPTAVLAKQPSNRSVSVADKSNILKKQKNITDFFQSKFTQRTDDSRTMDLASFDRDNLKLVREAMETVTKREIKDAIEKKKEPRRLDNAPKAKQLRSKENNLKRPAAKPPKVVDKAFIVNGTVYKRPTLPRPKPWVTNRLYHHLWKKMEPKFDLATRTRSERFIEQLARVVAVTIRRKKYNSYKLEVEALMKEMARLGIIKTRNDFYDFCYDFLPYDFRIKATPILMPGNVQNIPYDPETLHTPILAESSRSG